MQSSHLFPFRYKAIVLALLIISTALPLYARIEEGVDTLVNFKGPNGAQPQSIIEDASGNFFGTTLTGGKFNKGIVFEITLSGQLKTLVDFNGANGASPEAGLLIGPDGSLYGTTKTGGTNNLGTIFKVTPNGAFTTLVNFTGANGAQPDSGLFLGVDGNIYGTTMSGGTADKGTVFKITPDGQLTTVTTFTGANGANPGSLVSDGNGNLYGSTNKGGAQDKGTIFKLGPDGQITTLVTFNGSNGAFPVSGLIKSQQGDFYGTTSDGGANNLGTVFKVAPDGTLTSIFSFNGANGAHPDSGLVEWNNGYFYMIRLWQNMTYKSARVQWSGDNFVGTTSAGGAPGNGTVFRVGNDGNLVTLVAFTGVRGNDLGIGPNSLVAGDDGNLYGTTSSGGTDSQGTVWRLQLQQWPLPVAGETDGAQAGGVNLRAQVVSQ